MSHPMRALVLVLAKVGALVLAVGAGGYLVVRAQGLAAPRVEPPPQEQPAFDVAAPPVAPAPTTPELAGEVPTQPGGTTGVDAPVFLPSTKMALPLPSMREVLGPLPFLPSSKSLGPSPGMPAALPPQPAKAPGSPTQP